MENKIQLADLTDYNSSQLALIRSQVAPGITDLEFALLLQTAKLAGLNLIAKEIWCYPTQTKNGRRLLMFAGRDGFRRKAQENPNFSTVNSMEVCANDEFSMGTEDGEMKIAHRQDGKNRGGVTGAYAIVKMKDGNKVVEWADITTYDKRQNTWASHQAEMIKKVAEVHALKKVANLSSIYAEEDFTIKDGKAYTRETTAEETNADKLRTVKTITAEEKKEVLELIKQTGKDIEKVLVYYKKEKLEDFNSDEIKDVITLLKSIPLAKKQKPPCKKTETPIAKKMREAKEIAQIKPVDAEASEMFNKISAKKTPTKDEQEFVADINDE